MQSESAVTQDGIRECMLPHQGRLLHIGPKAQAKSNANANTSRLMDAPEEDADCQQVWQPNGLCQTQQHIQHQTDQQTEANEPRTDGQQQGLTTRHDHGVLPFVAA
jgi:hypothetical protein